MEGEQDPRSQWSQEDAPFLLFAATSSVVSVAVFPVCGRAEIAWLKETEIDRQGYSRTFLLLHAVALTLGKALFCWQA